MYKTGIRIAALFGMIAVATGAFGAHALKSKLSPEMIDVWNKAVLYQFIHVLALLAVSALPNLKETYRSYAAWMFTAGIVLFSGSLYILSTRELFTAQVNWLGPVTPFGGLCFIAGWFLLFLAADLKGVKF